MQVPSLRRFQWYDGEKLVKDFDTGGKPKVAFMPVPPLTQMLEEMTGWTTIVQALAWTTLTCGDPDVDALQTGQENAMPQVMLYDELAKFPCVAFRVDQTLVFQYVVSERFVKLTSFINNQILKEWEAIPDAEKPKGVNLPCREREIMWCMLKDVESGVLYVKVPAHVHPDSWDGPVAHFDRPAREHLVLMFTLMQGTTCTKWFQKSGRLSTM